MKVLLLLCAIAFLVTVPLTARAQLSPPVIKHLVYLPYVAREVNTCWHPWYDELLEHVGEQVCYEEVSVEVVYYVETFDGPECVFIASVFATGNPEWWAGAVWVLDHSGPCYDLRSGSLVPLEAKVLGAHRIVGRTYEDGITIPVLEI